VEQALPNRFGFIGLATRTVARLRSAQLSG
jgi:hypothetical protein